MEPIVNTPISNPLHEKYKTEAEKLNRRRKTATDTSKEIVVRREAFFDRLALMNAGALTFSVTLLSRVGDNRPHHTFFLYSAWILLVVALGACLTRNLSHQHYQLADSLTKMAESEISVIDVDHEILTTQTVLYSDSAEPFDNNREVALNRSNREFWKKTLEREKRKESRHWKFVIASEWVAGTSMVVGFLFLVLFAVRNL
jgi:hypothetical protein